MEGQVSGKISTSSKSVIKCVKKENKFEKSKKYFEKYGDQQFRSDEQIHFKCS